MAKKTAQRTFNKVADKCPKCGSNAPKEIVDTTTRKFSLIWFVLCALTIVGLLFFPLYYRKTEGYKAYCSECGDYFLTE